MKIVVGLGNPGEKYQKTRHNIGFLALDEILGPVKWREDKKFQALLYEAGDTIFVKPLTFMNNSGKAVYAIMNYYGLVSKKLGFFKKKDFDYSDSLFVIHDDLDLNLGDYRLATDSRSAGHNGVQSIINHLKTQKFKRWRLGIKSELKDKMPADKFVLSNFSAEELALAREVFKKIDLK